MGGAPHGRSCKSTAPRGGAQGLGTALEYWNNTGRGIGFTLPLTAPEAIFRQRARPQVCLVSAVHVSKLVSSSLPPLIPPPPPRPSPSRSRSTQIEVEAWRVRASRMESESRARAEEDVARERACLVEARSALAGERGELLQRVARAEAIGQAKAAEARRFAASSVAVFAASRSKRLDCAVRKILLPITAGYIRRITGSIQQPLAPAIPACLCSLRTLQ